MRRLMDLATLRRPRWSARPDTEIEPEDAFQDVDPDALATLLRAQTASAPTPAGPPPGAEPVEPEPDPYEDDPAQQIWDMELGLDDDDHDGEAAEPRLATRGLTAAPPLSAKDVGPAEPIAPPTRAGRPKTRILGFHTDQIDPDPLSGPVRAPAAPGLFPAGWLVVVDGPGRGAAFSVSAGVSTIGRGADQSICLDFGDQSVSRENHASVAYDEEQNRFFIGHGGKSNVVRRNGNPVLSTEALLHGDLIRVGRTTLRFVALCGEDFTWEEADTGQDEA